MKRQRTVARLVLALLLMAGAFTLQTPAAESSVCTEGQITMVFGANCSCDGIRTPRDTFKCIGGQWVWQSFACGPPFCQGLPGGDDCEDQPFSCPYEPNNYCPPWCSCCY